MAARGGQRIKRWIWALPAAWAIWVSGYALFAPTITHISAGAQLLRAGRQEAIPLPAPEPREWRTSQYEEGGLALLAPRLAIPVALSLCPLLIPARRIRRIVGIAATFALGLFCVLAAFSLGPYFMPVLALMIAALGIDGLLT